jgi:hypothetical protein
VIAYIEAEKPTGTQLIALVGHQRVDGSLSPNLVDDLGSMLVSDIGQSTVDELARRRFRDCQPNTIVRQLITPVTAVLNYAAKPGRRWCERPEFERPEYDDGRVRVFGWQSRKRRRASSSTRSRARGERSAARTTSAARIGACRSIRNCVLRSPTCGASTRNGRSF